MRMLKASSFETDIPMILVIRKTGENCDGAWGPQVKFTIAAACTDPEPRSRHRDRDATAGHPLWRAVFADAGGNGRFHRAQDYGWHSPEIRGGNNNGRIARGRASKYARGCASNKRNERTPAQRAARSTDTNALAIRSRPGCARLLTPMRETKEYAHRTGLDVTNDLRWHRSDLT